MYATEVDASVVGLVRRARQACRARRAIFLRREWRGVPGCSSDPQIGEATPNRMWRRLQALGWINSLMPSRSEKAAPATNTPIAASSDQKYASHPYPRMLIVGIAGAAVLSDKQEEIVGCIGE